MKLFEKIYNKIYLLKANICKSIEYKINTLSDTEKRIYKKCFIGTTAALGILSMGSIFNNNFIASSQAKTDFKSFINEFYGWFLGIATVLAVVIIAANLCILMTSKNQRKVEECVAWIKSVAVAYICFLLVSIFIKMGEQLFNSIDTKANGSGANVLFH